MRERRSFCKIFSNPSDLFNICFNSENSPCQTNWFRHIFNFALAKKSEEVHKGIVRRNSVWDSLIFWWVRGKVGGNVRLIITGSAPLKGNVVTFLRSALGCILVEGYGQTECVAPSTLTIQGDPQPDHVGPPLPCNNLKLEDIPDMEYWANRGQGEVCVKGANVMLGYYRSVLLSTHHSISLISPPGIQR